MEEIKEIDIKELAKGIVKRGWIVVLCTVVFGLAALIYAVNFVEPTYKASVTLYVNNNSETSSSSVSSSNLAVALQLAKTYVNIIQSDLVLDKVVQKAELTSVSTEDIRKMMSAEVVDETEMFRVSIISPNPKMSADIANAIANIAPDEIRQVIEGSSAKVVDFAKVPTSRYAPNYATTTILGGLVGGALAVVVIAIFLLSDTRIKGKEDLTRICQIPVLGTIPDFTEVAKYSEQNVDKKERRKA
ncbi:MAG: hypothetical protein IJZ56_03790 [Oscillospiraceae bacterium]|nr:hypothetical protein [Oscillospiraceae bacterium]